MLLQLWYRLCFWSTCFPDFQRHSLDRADRLQIYHSSMSSFHSNLQTELSSDLSVNDACAIRTAMNRNDHIHNDHKA